MATHRLPIGLGSLFPDNEFASFIPYDLVDTGTTRNAIVLNFDSASDGEVSGVLQVPKNWVSGSTNLIVKWTSQGTSGNFDIEFLHRAVANAGRSDTNTTPATRTDTLIAAAPSTGGEYEFDSISLTDTDWTVDDIVQFQFRRDANDATNDTLASDAQVWSLEIEYVDA